MSIREQVPLDRVTRKSMNAMRKALKDVKFEMQKSFSLPKSGNLYRRNNGQYYVASAPGEAPAIKEGLLDKSIRTSAKRQSGQIIGTVQVNAPYAALLEGGGGFVAPRPFLRPAFEKVRRRFPTTLKKANPL